MSETTTISEEGKFITVLTGPAAKSIIDALNDKACLTYYDVSKGGETVLIVTRND